jgi:hypothetical protein
MQVELWNLVSVEAINPNGVAREKRPDQQYEEGE